MRRARRIGLLVAVLGATAASAVAAPADYTIRGDAQIGSFKTAGPQDLSDARAAFGSPTSVKRRSNTECRAVWNGRSISISLLDLNGTNDPCRNGNFLRATMIGRAWHTSKGLRIGDSVARLRRLYPRAELHRGAGPDTGWWLVPRRACEAIVPYRYPGLLARAGGARVTAFVVRIGVCE